MLGFQVTLTTLNTNYNLLTLVRAIDANFIDVGDFVIQADDDGGSQKFLLGDSNLSSTRYAESMTIGDFSAHYRGLAGVYARCDASGKKLNIQVIRP